MVIRKKPRSRSVTLAMGVMIVGALALAIGFAVSRSRSGGIAGAGLVDSGRAGGGDARGDEPLADLRDARLAGAFSRYASPADGGPGAEALRTLAAALLARDRLVLGWAALEAAWRIAPDHEATRRALSDLESKLDLASGPERVARLEAAESVELLRSVRGGPALGLLAMGLARYAEDPGRERVFLDRLSTRGRPGLRAVDGTGGAVKLVSRLLMETGRPAEVGDLLRPLAATPGADPEAAWLLSRAALQLGRPEEADAMLEHAEGFGRDGSSPEPSPFVGSRKCAECHRSTYRAAQGESPHARTIHFGPSLKDVPIPDRPLADPGDPRIRHDFVREAADRIRLESRDESGRVARAVVSYALGSGEHGITMLARDEATGTTRQLRVSFYASDRSWRATKGFHQTPHNPEEFIGLPLSEKAVRQCVHCHATWFRAAMPDPSMPAGPETLDRGIGCERCHGPGLNHVKAVETGYAESAIAVTEHSPPGRLLQSCGECHASNGLVEPSDPEFTRLQGTTLKFSRCFTSSGGAIHCATCHDPHRGLDTTTSRYEAKCLGCHAAPATTGPGRPGSTVCPVNPSSGCIDCHMPRVEDPSFQIRFTDHRIRARRGAAREGGAPTTGHSQR